MAVGEFLYKKIYSEIKDQILRKEYTFNEKIPSEDEIKTEFGVSAITVKKALKMLVDDGLVERIPGKGTFVMHQPILKDEAENKPNLIGVIMEHATTPFGLDMVYNMDHIAETLGYKLFIRYSYCDREKETQEIRYLLSMNVKGLIIMPSHGRHYNPEILKLFIDGFPVIMVDKKFDGVAIPSVRTNNEEAVAILVNALYRSGCRKISCISTDDLDATSLKERQLGFRSEMKKLKMKSSGSCIVPSNPLVTENKAHDNTVESIYKFLDNNKDLDAVVCLEYSVVLALTIAANMLGIVLDKDIRVATIDEDYLSPYGYTFMHCKQNEVDIAKKAVKFLVDYINGTAPAEDDYLISALFNDRK